MKFEWSNEIFAENLRRYKDEANLSQKELAAIAGVSSPTVSEWLHGKKMPRMDKVERIANYFGIEKSDLLERKRFTKEQGIFEARLLKDEETMRMIRQYYKLDEKNKRAIQQMIETLSAE